MCCSGARQLAGARFGRVVRGTRRADPAAAVGAAGGAHPRGARAPRADAERAGRRGALPRVRGHVRHVRARPVRRQGVHVPLCSSSSRASNLRRRSFAIISHQQSASFCAPPPPFPPTPTSLARVR